MAEAALFSRTGQSAYDPRGKPLELDKKKSGSARVNSTGIRRSGEAAPFAAQPEWLMTPRIWALQLDKKKSEAPVQLRQA